MLSKYSVLKHSLIRKLWNFSLFVNPNKPLSVFFVLTIIMLLSINCMACYSDFDCVYGQACVKTRNSFSADGVCIDTADKYGNKQIHNPTSNVKEINGCQFNTDCAIGATCYKRNYELTGVCLK